MNSPGTRSGRLRPASARTARCRTPHPRVPRPPRPPAPTPCGTPWPHSPPAAAPAPAPAPPAHRSRPAHLLHRCCRPDAHRSARTAPWTRSRHPAGRRRTAHARPARHPTGPAPRSSGTAAEPAAPPPAPPERPDLTQQDLQAGVVLHQMVDLQQRQPPATTLRLRGDEHPHSGADPISSGSAPAPADPPPDPQPPASATSRTGSTPHGPPPGPAHAAPPTPPRTAGCHAGRSPTAPPPGMPPAAPAHQTPTPSTAHTHHPPQPPSAPAAPAGFSAFTGRALTGGEKVVEEDALLQGCERVDVRYVRGAARHPGDHPHQLRVTQPGQRHHLRRDHRAPPGSGSAEPPPRPHPPPRRPERPPSAR